MAPYIPRQGSGMAFPSVSKALVPNTGKTANRSISSLPEFSTWRTSSADTMMLVRGPTEAALPFKVAYPEPFNITITSSCSWV
jgi:hypothetical protein